MLFLRTDRAPGLNSQAMLRATRAVRIERAVVFDQRDELAEPLVELAHEETVKGDAVLEQPEKCRAVHQGMRVSRKAMRSYWRGSFLSMVPSPNQLPVRMPAKRDSLAGLRGGAEPHDPGRDAGPGIEAVAAMADIGALRNNPFRRSRGAPVRVPSRSGHATRTQCGAIAPAASRRQSSSRDRNRIDADIMTVRKPRSKPRKEK